MTDHHAAFEAGHRPVRDASVVVARDTDGLVALLSAHFPRHGGEYLFLPGPWPCCWPTGDGTPGRQRVATTVSTARTWAVMTSRLWTKSGSVI